MLTTEKDYSNLMPLQKVAESLPNFNGKPICHSTIWRWCRKGLNGIKLKHVRVGRRLCTSQEHVDAFFEALTKKYEREDLDTFFKKYDKESPVSNFND